MPACIVCGRKAPASFKEIADRPVVYCHPCFAKGGEETAKAMPLANIFFPERPARDSHENPTPWEAVAAEITGPGPLVLAENQYSPSPGRRVLVFRDGTLLADRWVKASDLPQLEAALATGRRVRRGECDAMYATGWSYLWTVDGPPLEIWDHEGTLVRQDGDLLRFRGGDSCRAIDVAHVHGYLEDAWVTRGVRCVLKSGTSITVAEDKDSFVLVDPTYDGLNISFDAAWVVSLARALCTVLAVPLQTDDPL
jgi:hypothetical protein